jgi:glycosyltransferase involved in cell wall biosynthesis
LQASDIFVFPTENDAFPSSIVEAMACALPVITTPVGAIKTIITHQEDGILIEPGNEEQLFGALDVMIGSTERSLRLGPSARQKVLNSYSANTVTEQYLALFQNTLRFG